MIDPEETAARQRVQRIGRLRPVPARTAAGVKVLLDEDLDHDCEKRIGAHDVFTVRYLGSSGLENGDLLSTAEQNGIEVFVTADSKPQLSAESRRAWPSLFFRAANWPIIQNHTAVPSAAESQR